MTDQVKKIHTQADFDTAIQTGQFSEFELAGPARIAIISTDGEMVFRVFGDAQPYVEVYDSAQPRVETYDAARPHIVAIGYSRPHVEARDGSRPHVEAYGSAQPHIVAYGDSQPYIVASGTSQPRIVAYGSAQPCIAVSGSAQPCIMAYGSSRPHVEAYDASQLQVAAYETARPHVEAYGYVHLSVTGRLTVTAGPQVAVLITGADSHVTGGQQIRHDRPTTAEAWCTKYGVPVADGTCVLYKGVHANYTSYHDPEFRWMPGTMPSASEIDTAECGSGLHFFPRPHFVRQFFSDPNVRIIACPVRVVDIRVPLSPTPAYPAKVKAVRVCAPIWEVDEQGNSITRSTGETV